MAAVFIVKPELSVGPQEQVDGDVARQRVEGRLPEAGDDGALPLDGHHLGEEALGGVDGWVIDLVEKEQFLFPFLAIISVLTDGAAKIIFHYNFFLPPHTAL